VTVAVLCRPDEAVVAGSAAALALAGRCRAPHALVAVWSGGHGAPVRAPATSGARRLAATLASRGHDATATGRLTLLQLAGSLGEAAPEAVRALAAAPEIPAAVVLAGARDEAADGLLRAQDGVIVALPAEAGEAVADLALAGLAPLGVPARALTLPPTPAPARALAASGIAAVPPLRGAVEAALAELPALRRPANEAVEESG
jgi:hypothetical protein